MAKSMQSKHEVSVRLFVGLIALRERYYRVLVSILACIVLLSVSGEGPNLNSDSQPPQDHIFTRSTTWTPAEGWSEPFRFTHNVHGLNISSLPDIASEGSNVHLVFQHWQKDQYPPYVRGPRNRDLNIYYTRSTDGGRSWSASGEISNFVQLNSPVKDKFWGFAMRPTIAVSDSAVHVAWAQTQTGIVGTLRIRYRRSLDSGLTWMNETIMRTDNASWHPEILANGSSVHLFWQEENMSWENLFLGRIYYSRSLDKGATWEARKELARPKGVSCFIGSVAEDRRRLFLVYGCEDPIVTYFKRSLDNGKTWDDGQGNVNQSTMLIAGTEEDDWIPIGIAVWRDNVTVVLRKWTWSVDHSSFTYQILSMTSHDLGATWSSPTVLVDHTDVPSNRSCIFDSKPEECGNMIGFSRLASEGPNLYLVWTDSRVERHYNFELFFMKSNDFGRTWSPQYRLTEAQDTVDLQSIWASDGIIHVVWADWKTGDWKGGTSDICYMRYPDFDSPLPEVETIGASEISGTEALLKGRLNTLGNYTSANVFFEWKPEGDGKWKRLEVGKLYTAREFKAHLTGLTPEKRYEFRAGASTEKEVFGRILSFTTRTISPPTNLSGRLVGEGNRDVLISWNASEDDASLVSSYTIYFSTTYDEYARNYSILGVVPSNGSSDYFFVHEGGGHGDPETYFYAVEANSPNYSSSISEKQIVKFTTPLVKGWNLLSIPLPLEGMNASEALKTLNYDRITYYERGRNYSGWRSFYPLKSYESPPKLENGKGYWIHLLKEGNLTIVGELPLERRIDLKRGWNLVAYPGLSPSNLSTALSEVPFERVEGFDESSPPHYLKVLMPDDQLLPSSAFWIFVRKDCTWTFDVLGNLKRRK